MIKIKIEIILTNPLLKTHEWKNILLPPPIQNPNWISRTVGPGLCFDPILASPGSLTRYPKLSERFNYYYFNILIDIDVNIITKEGVLVFW